MIHFLVNFYEGLYLDSLFFIWMSSSFSTMSWRDHFSSLVLPLLLCWKSHNCIYVSISGLSIPFCCSNSLSPLSPPLCLSPLSFPSLHPLLQCDTVCSLISLQVLSLCHISFLTLFYFNIVLAIMSLLPLPINFTTLSWYL